MREHQSLQVVGNPDPQAQRWGPGVWSFNKFHGSDVCPAVGPTRYHAGCRSSQLLLPRTVSLLLLGTVFPKQTVGETQGDIKEGPASPAWPRAPSGCRAVSTEVMETTQKQRALRNRDQDRPHPTTMKSDHSVRALECVSPSPAVSPPHPHLAGPTCVSLRARCLSVPSVGIHAGDL